MRASTPSARILCFNAINTLLTAFDSNYSSLRGSVSASGSAARASSTCPTTWAKNLTDNGSDRSNAPAEQLQLA